MHLRIASTRTGLLALAVIAALFSFAPNALAARDHVRGHDRGGATQQRWRGTSQRFDGRRSGGYAYRQPSRFRASVRIGIGSGGYYGGSRGYYGGYSYGGPRFVACAPRFVSYRPNRIVIVRPAPYVRIGGVFGAVGISAILGPQRVYSDYDYGCNFCDAHFSSYGSYEDHVLNCPYRPADVQIQCRNWDDQGYNDYRSSRDDDPGYRANDRYEDRGDADDRDDDRDYDDGN
jgi:hypothetical protein